MKQLLEYIIPVLAIIIFTVLNTYGKIDFRPSDYLNFGLTLLTYFYVVFTWEMLERMKTESYLERRPYIIADFDSTNSNMSFYIENIGKTPANNVEIKVHPDFQLLKAEDTINTTILKDKIDFYPPHKKVETYIAPTFEFFKKNPDKYSVSIKYQDSFEKIFTEKILLDLNHHKKQSYIKEKGLEDIVKSLDEVK